MNITIDNMGKEQDKYLTLLSKGEEIWCTENSLKWILKQLFPNEEIIHNKKIKFDKATGFRPDFLLKNKKIIVEFHGPQHFTNPICTIKDINKKDTAERFGYEYIEIPYFVQLTKNVLKSLFKDIIVNNDFSNNFPHGFIHPGALSFGHFSVSGLQRTIYFLKILPIEVKEQCFKSLEKRSIIDNIPFQVYNPLCLENTCNIFI